MKKILALFIGLMLFALPVFCYADIAGPSLLIIPIGIIAAVIAVIVIVIVLIVKLIRNKRY